MKRDDLIEELKKAPANGEVVIVLKAATELVNEASDDSLLVRDLRIQRVTTIPKIEIEVSYD